MFLGIIGSFIFSVVVTICIILAAFSEKDKAEAVNKMINKSLQEKVETPVKDTTQTILNNLI